MSPLLYLLLLLSLILCCLAASQNAARAQTNNPLIHQSSNPAPSMPTLPPLPVSPVDTFRKVLAMSPAEREKFLDTRTPAQREVVLLKLDEYQGLPADQREERLRALQVRVRVRQLIKLPVSNRVERLAVLQPAERQMIEARLAEWDRLPIDLQREVLTNEIAIRHIARSPGFMFNTALPPFPPDAKVARELAHWGRLSEPERAEILRHVERFFEEYTAKERAKILALRADMKIAAAPIANLPKEQSERYVEGFKRFNALTPADRRRFLINADHWQKLTPEQRQSWRVLAKKLSAPAAPPPIPGRPSAAVIPTADRAAAELPSR